MPATIYHGFGISPEADMHDHLGRPHRVVHGKPLTSLFGETPTCCRLGNFESVEATNGRSDRAAAFSDAIQYRPDRRHWISVWLESLPNQ
jgi:hypothetical protein